MKRQIISIAVVIIAIIGIGIWGFSRRVPMAVETATPTDSSAPEYSIPPYVEPTPLPSPTIITGANWLEEPRKVSEVHLFVGIPEAEFYQIGTINGDRILVSANWDCTPGGCNTYFFREQGKEYFYVEQDSTQGHQGVLNNGIKFAAGVTLDSTSSYIGLRVPKQFSYKGIDFQSSGAPVLLESISNSEWQGIFKRIDTVAAGELFIRELPQRVDDKTVGPLVFNDFFLKLPSNMYIEVTPQYAFRRDDGTLKVTFNDGTVPTDTYSLGMIRGCGGYGDATITQPEASRIRDTGRTATGEAIYEFVDMNDPIVRLHYEYMSDSDGDGIREYYDYNTQTAVPITLQDYASRHVLLLYKDSLNRWLVITNPKYGPQAECGKPVIYLYPEQPTHVSVKVGADVTVSEPEYGNGWNVLAEPTGKQTLFWEGTGFGMYPAVNTGFVVAQENLEATLWKHLQQLGLNERESIDFMEFWLPHMPTTPYVRLTWFGTKEMDELAPLYVRPRPDTVIRIFLDFEGLQKPVTMQPQTLSSIPRKGFTLVEWGGLLNR